jgi:hypothetical protein
MSSSNKQMFEYLTEGINENGWGYASHRLTVTSKLKHKIPYTFTSCGFKDNNNKWYLCLRMNVDQVSPQKSVPMEESTNFHQEWDKMMEEFAIEYAKKSPNSNINKTAK